MQLCAITDRRSIGNPNPPDARLEEAALRHRLLALTEGWSAGGVPFIQLREKDLVAEVLQSLVEEMMARIDGNRSKLLVNIQASGAALLAVAARADGVHLAGKPAPGAAGSVRQAFRAHGREAIVSVPCHSLEDIDLARKEQVDMILFSPVFEKLSAPPEVSKPQGLEALRQACAVAQGIPVFALGGVTIANASACIAAGAAGVAGIRLFMTDDWRRLRTSP
jgi:thiamine-phosphate pyrophosphorylase